MRTGQRVLTFLLTHVLIPVFCVRSVRELNAATLTLLIAQSSLNTQSRVERRYANSPYTSVLTYGRATRNQTYFS
ncbi:hypothetical protein [Coleofasciculus sp. H7-2]|uniref:hypothetical protein n=1 Tax=Coleofasciculus sp. H7-2 TaxID=3351545 RepID=UPI00366F2D37